jgi:hypothetical protein
MSDALHKLDWERLAGNLSGVGAPVLVFAGNHLTAVVARANAVDRLAYGKNHRKNHF